jgi:hypothetical protein
MLAIVSFHADGKLFLSERSFSAFALSQRPIVPLVLPHAHLSRPSARVDESREERRLEVAICFGNDELAALLTVSQVVTTNDYIWLYLARAVSREIRKRANNVNRQYFLQKYVDKVKLKVRFCSL